MCPTTLIFFHTSRDRRSCGMPCVLSMTCHRPAALTPIYPRSDFPSCCRHCRCQYQPKPRLCRLQPHQQTFSCALSLTVLEGQGRKAPWSSARSRNKRLGGAWEIDRSDILGLGARPPQLRAHGQCAKCTRCCWAILSIQYSNWIPFDSFGHDDSWRAG